MTFSFDINLTADRDKIRLRVGDTDSRDVLLDDETIDAILTIRNGDVTTASLDSVRAILGVLSRDIDRNNLGMSANRSQKMTHYEGVLAELVKEARVMGGIFVGGVSRSEKRKLEADSDFEQPELYLGVHDNPSALSRSGRNRGPFGCV